MARIKLDVQDQLLVWAATAPIGEVEVTQKRIGGILSQRRSAANKKPLRQGRPANPALVVAEQVS